MITNEEKVQLALGTAFECEFCNKIFKNSKRYTMDDSDAGTEVEVCKKCFKGFYKKIWGHEYKE